MRMNEMKSERLMHWAILMRRCLFAITFWRLISAISRVALLMWKVKVCHTLFCFQVSRGVRAFGLRRIPPCRFVVTASPGSSVWTRVVHPFQAPQGTTVASSASIVVLSKVTLLVQRMLHNPARYRIEKYFQISSFQESNANITARTSWRNRYIVRTPSRSIGVYRCQDLIDLWVLIRTNCKQRYTYFYEIIIIWFIIIFIINSEICQILIEQQKNEIYMIRYNNTIKL